jgi:hypothetical protein
MEVRQRLELTLGEGCVNADSRIELQLKLLTPLKPDFVNENPDFARQANAFSPDRGYRRTCKRRGSLRALAVEITVFCRDSRVKGRPRSEKSGGGHLLQLGGQTADLARARVLVNHALGDGAHQLGLGLDEGGLRGGRVAAWPGPGTLAVVGQAPTAWTAVGVPSTPSAAAAQRTIGLRIEPGG